jgi:NAD(P)-dependent dehydrogenase (short-subunit alcohol dehydrogenase family)
MARLDGKVAVITGGASGMGEATAHLFVREGARVVIADVQRDKGEAVARSIGADCVFVPADVAAAEDVQGMVATAIDKWGKLDVIFNNAGIGGGEVSVADCSEEVWDRTIAVDLKGVWLGMKFAVPHLIANGGGSIISTSSIAGLTGFASLGAYSAAKAGVIGLTRVAAIEYAQHYVRVNCICPGGVLTPIVYANPNSPVHMDPEEMRPLMARGQPIQRAGEPQDIANAALWLASDESSFVTGQAIPVDGGWMAAARPGGRRVNGEE